MARIPPVGRSSSSFPRLGEPERLESVERVQAKPERVARRTKTANPAKSANLVWETPPSRGTNRGQSRYFTLLDQLVANPGRWARVFTGSRSRAYSFAGHMKIIIKANPDRYGALTDWQTAARRTPDTESGGSTYMRYQPKET